MADKLKTLMDKRMADLEAASDDYSVSPRPAPKPSTTAPVTTRPTVVPRAVSEQGRLMEQTIQKETEERRKKNAAEKAATIAADAKRQNSPAAPSLKGKVENRKAYSFSDQDY